MPAYEVERRGGNGLVVGPLVLFGDEALLKRVADALGDRGGRCNRGAGG
jgi:hypothetical protein